MDRKKFPAHRPGPIFNRERKQKSLCDCHRAFSVQMEIFSTRRIFILLLLLPSNSTQNSISRHRRWTLMAKRDERSIVPDVCSRFAFLPARGGCFERIEAKFVRERGNVYARRFRVYAGGGRGRYFYGPIFPRRKREGEREGGREREKRGVTYGARRAARAKIAFDSGV